MEAIRVFSLSLSPVIHVAGGQEGLQEPEHATLKDLWLAAAALILRCRTSDWVSIPPKHRLLKPMNFAKSLGVFCWHDVILRMYALLIMTLGVT